MSLLLQLAGWLTGADVEGIVKDVTIGYVLTHVWNTLVTGGASAFFRGVTVLCLVTFAAVIVLLLVAHLRQEGWLASFRLTSWTGILVAVALLVPTGFGTMVSLTATVVLEVHHEFRETPERRVVRRPDGRAALPAPPRQVCVPSPDGGC